ncbi:TerC family protein [Flavobacterium psychrophilum]|uniref:Membrane protein, TerC family n=4 Tax=Flavobacterium psychrophilum TaxID=96345 RepID=A6GXK2_FLAPJ|nr:TerC family protein [Flavobacterium psychrophilum]AIG29616.1 membrane protein [Flavobacterium psychrophilum]AIG31893.1 membrane protein [Flavobacterium psychrophilum]AIG34047.1 membrane protein [Flavobacterium psychrophilum]AIG36411.1 membrane protein [Flavobacterium psychrophilum]AIG38676.1 membrane protein [Flavobacterium psychrophilum]
MIELLTNPDAWIALLTLTFLEIILGIDNIVFLSIVSGKLAEKDQPKARRIGLLLAMAFRIILLFGITWVLGLQKSILDINLSFFSAHITGQSLIIFGGGLFLLYKSVSEIHHKMEGEEEEGTAKSGNTLVAAIIQIAVLNLVFSFDSILTAVGLISMKSPAEGGFGYDGALAIMILAIIISVVIMMIFAGPVSKFVNNHPTIQILGLSFLILIGVMLLAEGSHLAHFRFGNDVEVGSIPKGYLYFSIFFSLFVEFLNLRMKKTKNPVKLHNSTIKDKELENSDITD